MLLSDKFDQNVQFTFETETRVNKDVDKDDAVKMTVHADLTDTKANDVINKDLAVAVQGAFRKSFETQDAFRKWAEKRNHEYTVHVSEIGHKIESVEQIKSQIKGKFSQLSEEEKLEVLREEGIEI